MGVFVKWSEKSFLTDFAKTGFASPIALQIGCGDCPDWNVRSPATHSLIFERLANLFTDWQSFLCPKFPLWMPKHFAEKRLHLKRLNSK